MANTATSTDFQIQQLNDLLKGLGSQSQSATTQGQSALGPVIDYLTKAVKGDPSTMLSMAGPGAGKVLDQYDAARKSISAGSPRGGGTTGALAQSHVQEASQLSDLLNSTRSGAAKDLGTLGSGLLSTGLSGQSATVQGLGSLIQSLMGKDNADTQFWGQILGSLGSSLISLIP